MALTPKLELRQGQALVMTPQLQQAIKLLQLSSLDLSAYVDSELERNPLLDRREEDDAPREDGGGERDGDGDGAGAREAAGGDGEDSGGAPGDGVSSDGAASEPADGGDGEVDGDWSEFTFAETPASSDLDTEPGDVFPDDADAGGTGSTAPGPGEASWSGMSGSGGSFDGGDYDLEAVVSGEVTLRQHLGEQLALAVADPAQRLIGQELIESIDDAGYLQGDLDAIAERLGADRDMVEQVLAVLQTFEPAGVFARSLAECLAIQLRERNRYDPAMQTFVANIELMARREFGQLKRLCRVDDEDIAEMAAEIRALDPKPGMRFGAITVQPIVPDIFVRARPDGTWHIEVNSDALPKVLVNQEYHATLMRGTRNEADKTYLSDCLQNANWLVKSLDQRARTVLKVASEIVRQQDAFFARGVRHLRPLNLKTVADAIGMHESTVSRVTSNKYMATPRGTFELKYFFTSSIASADGGEAHSAEAVRHRIRALIDGEKPEAVLSDDQIVQTLRTDGVDIARRTVAKYREAMHIASSVQRRREKRAMR